MLRATDCGVRIDSDVSGIGWTTDDTFHLPKKTVTTIHEIAPIGYMKNIEKY